ncbi:amidase signature domain-containing protein [Aspergillus granulosus]|uniref:Amidase signature domain-containing protein n=1 Tax=Aspergillus granulosus TaxID=176169 RepID=A0ABR4GSI6_9EURO
MSATALVAAKLRERDSMIPADWVLPEHILRHVQERSRAALDLFTETSLLTKREVLITEGYDAQALSTRIARSEFTAVEVCLAFCKRAAIAQQLTNCATEIFIDKALERAKFLDDYLRMKQEPYGPFHGVPISVKDCYNVEGQATTIGFVSFLGKPKAVKNSPIVDILRDNGALIYCKTNVPQTMMTMDTVNNVFGRTLNACNPHRTAGGSSGGEGALVRLRGSLLGVGTDIGGSIRVPSLCNGVYGFKPTADRIPHGEWVSGMRPGMPGLVSSAGPLASSPTDLTFFCKSVIQCEPWKRDTTALAIPWRDVSRKERLRIGLFKGDSRYPLTPPVIRALESAALTLEEAGHEVIELANIPSLEDGLQIAARYFLLDNKQTLTEHISAGGEQPIKALAYASPVAIVGSDERISNNPTIDDVFDCNAARSDYHNKMVAVWNRHDLDVVICPGGRAPAPPHDEHGVPVYTVVWNLVNFPASIIPFLRVDKSIDSSDDYDASAAHNLPIAVQIVGRTCQDEETLMATEVISEALGRLPGL